MKKLFVFLFASLSLVNCTEKTTGLPEYYNNVDQMLWVVSDLEKTMAQYQKLGFMGILDMGTAVVFSQLSEVKTNIRLARGNLGGAVVTWIQPVDTTSLFSKFRINHGDGAMSLVHRVPDSKELEKEIQRLEKLGIGVLDKITIETGEGTLPFVLMKTEKEGTYNLGFTFADSTMKPGNWPDPGNRHDMKLNQYAFAIRDPKPVSRFWHKLGMPEFEINRPELGETRYYGELVDHRLIQGWQRHGSVAYEWCIPVKPPIVYEDHIQQHGEGIHHLAFTVKDMDKVLEDYRSRGFVVSMGGTWGEKGKPGSGRYEYIDLEEAGGVTMELLWSFQE
jgi:methylmalonyl-CoA/ethylmalonyl-CoA epimerase